MKPSGSAPSTVAAKIDDKAIANLIFAAGIPRKHVGSVYLKLAGHALSLDEREAKSYVSRTHRHALIDEKRRHRRHPVLPLDPLSAVWDALAHDQIRPDDVERKKTLQALMQTGIALLSPHQRSLVRAWMDRSHEENVTEIHEALPQPCGLGAYHCKNMAFANLTRIVSGLAVATGNSDLRPAGAAACAGRRPGLRSRQKNARAIFKNPTGARLERGEGEA
ncbi:MAG: hypothetical protein JXP73_16795 [Deltaproteobacteria bacterium]|jgi:hypothetical protein|nr:hypothetical protein [Deltaproteobacteria bacterium]